MNANREVPLPRRIRPRLLMVIAVLLAAGLVILGIASTTGAINIPQQTLFLTGPTDRITITGYYNGSYENDRIFNHSGTGILSLSDLNTEYGNFVKWKIYYLSNGIASAW